MYFHTKSVVEPARLCRRCHRVCSRYRMLCPFCGAIVLVPIRIRVDKDELKDFLKTWPRRI